MLNDLKKTHDNTFIALQFLVTLICIPYIAWIYLGNPNWYEFFIGSISLFTFTGILIISAYFYDSKMRTT